MIEPTGLSFEERRQVENLYAQFDPCFHPPLDSLFQGLNREQVAALSHPLSDGRPLLIIAGAGSGKTSVLTRRVALLLLAGIPSERIFVSTFTVKAAGEMKERIGRLIADLAQSAPPPLKSRLDDLLRSFPRSWIGTFHSLCLRLLKEKSPDGFSPIEELGFPPGLNILSDADAKRLLKDIVQEFPVQPDLRDLAAAIDLAANELLTPEAVAAEKSYGGLDAAAVADAWAKYAETKRAQGQVDFTDLLYLAATAFADRRICAEGWRARFTHILIDEYQDTNVAQYAIATELAAARKNLFVVGDDDQSIYGFRGADIRNIRAFTQDYPDARVVRLIRNYRSTPVILGAANAVLADRPDSSTDKTLLAQAPEGDRPPEKIIVYEAADAADELNFLVFQIQELLQEGYAYKDIVVFYRVHELSEPIAAALRAAKIPVAEVGGKALLDNDLIKCARAFFRAVSVIGSKREGTFDPARGETAARQALRDIWSIGELGPKNKNDLGKLLALPAPERILLSEQAYVEAVRACESGETQHHLEQLWSAVHGAAQGLESLTPQDLANLMIDAFSLSSAASTDREIRGGLVLLKRFLSSRLPYSPPGRAGLDILITALSSSEQGEPLADLVQENAVRLLTIHASKGLEFPVVAVVGVEEDILPFVRPGTQTESAEERDAREEEELRLFYVAITRAKQRLILTGAARRDWYGRPVTHRPSRFLSRLPAELVIRGSSLSALDRAAHRTRQFFKDMFGA